MYLNNTQNLEEKIEGNHLLENKPTSRMWDLYNSKPKFISTALALLYFLTIGSFSLPVRAEPINPKVEQTLENKLKKLQELATQNPTIANELKRLEEEQYFLAPFTALEFLGDIDIDFNNQIILKGYVDEMIRFGNDMGKTIPNLSLISHPLKNINVGFNNIQTLRKYHDEIIRLAENISVYNSYATPYALPIFETFEDSNFKEIQHYSDVLISIAHNSKENSPTFYKNLTRDIIKNHEEEVLKISMIGSSFDNLEELTESCEILTDEFKDKNLEASYSNYINNILYTSTFYLGRLIDNLHENIPKREKAAFSLTPELCYFIIGQGQEIFTTSFNLIYDNLAYKLGNGKNILPQNEIIRTEKQQELVEEGRTKIIQFAKGIDPNEEYFTGFIMKASYFDRLWEILPKTEKEQKQFYRELLDLINPNKNLVRDAFYLAPTFRAVFLKEKYKKSFEDVLLNMYKNSEGIKKKAYGLIILSNVSLFSEKNQQEAIDITELVEKEYNILKEFYIPKEWFDDNKISMKLYFHNEGENVADAHFRYFLSMFSNKNPFNLEEQASYSKLGSYTIKKLANNKYELTKEIKNNKKNITIELIAEYTEILNIKEDLENPKIDIYGHRGHSYQVRDTITDEAKNAEFPYNKLIFLGSCGGFNAIPELDRITNGNADFISSTNRGLGVVNNALLYYLLDTIATGESWLEVKNKTLTNLTRDIEQIRTDIQRNLGKSQSDKLTIYAIKDYSFPGDLPYLMLKYLRN